MKIIWCAFAVYDILVFLGEGGPGLFCQLVKAQQQQGPQTSAPALLRKKQMYDGKKIYSSPVGAPADAVQILTSVHQRALKRDKKLALLEEELFRRQQDLPGDGILRERLELALVKLHSSHPDSRNMVEEEDDSSYLTMSMSMYMSMSMSMPPMCTPPFGCDGSCGNCAEVAVDRELTGCDCEPCQCIVCMYDSFCCGANGGYWDHICRDAALILCDCGNYYPTRTPTSTPTSAPHTYDVTCHEDISMSMLMPYSFSYSFSFDQNGSGYGSCGTMITYEALHEEDEDVYALNLSDDSGVAMELQFEFMWMGRQPVRQVGIGSNGQINIGYDQFIYSLDYSGPTFAQEITLWVNPRIAVVQADLDPSVGGKVLVRSSPKSFTVSYQNVPFWGYYGGMIGGAQATLYPDGGVDICFGGGHLGPRTIAMGLQDGNMALAFTGSSMVGFDDYGITSTFPTCYCFCFDPDRDITTADPTESPTSPTCPPTSESASCSGDPFIALMEGEADVVQLVPGVNNYGNGWDFSLPFDFNWMGQRTLTAGTLIMIGENGEINIPTQWGYLNSWFSFTTYGIGPGYPWYPRISLAGTALNLRRGNGKVLVKATDAMFTVSYQDVMWHTWWNDDPGLFNGQVTLYADGRVSFCYSTGSIPGGYSISAGLEEEDMNFYYPLHGPRFDAEGITSQYPACLCACFDPQEYFTPAPTQTPTGTATPTTSSEPTGTSHCRVSFTELTAGVAGAEILSLGDDQAVSVPLKFNFNWFGTRLIPIGANIFVGSNGQLSLAGNTWRGDWNPVPIGSSGTGNRIAFAQVDLDPSSVRNGVLVSNKATSLLVSFQGVPYYGTSSTVSVQTELFPDGTVSICYGSGTFYTRFAAGMDNASDNIHDPIGNWDLVSGSGGSFTNQGLLQGPLYPENSCYCWSL